MAVSIRAISIHDGWVYSNWIPQRVRPSIPDRPHKRRDRRTRAGLLATNWRIQPDIAAFDHGPGYTVHDLLLGDRLNAPGRRD
jgi:hypothetical protein